MSTRLAAGCALVAGAVGIIIVRLLVTSPGCSGENFSNWSGWLYVLPATAALAVGTSVLVTTVSDKGWVAVASGIAAGVVGGIAIFYIAVFDELDGCVF